MGKAAYSIVGVAPGKYFLYSVVRYGNERCATLGAMFTPAVACGLGAGCANHSPIAVTVDSGKVTGGVDVTDWYEPLPQTDFQPPPAAIVPVYDFVENSGPFLTAREAAADFAQATTRAIPVGEMSTCPPNRACEQLGVEVDGVGAAYFADAAGSNTDLQACGVYVYLAKGGWQPFDWTCHLDRVFPAVGAKGLVNVGIQPPGSCANVREAPGLAGKVVGGLPQGTPVVVDGGPDYVLTPSYSGLWWHIANRGWMVHEYLRLSP